MVGSEGNEGQESIAKLLLTLANLPVRSLTTCSKYFYFFWRTVVCTWNEIGMMAEIAFENTLAHRNVTRLRIEVGLWLHSAWFARWAVFNPMLYMVSQIWDKHSFQCGNISDSKIWVKQSARCWISGNPKFGASGQSRLGYIWTASFEVNSQPNVGYFVSRIWEKHSVQFFISWIPKTSD